MQSRKPAPQDGGGERQAACTRPPRVRARWAWRQHTRLPSPHRSPHRLHRGAQAPARGHDTGTNRSEDVPSERDMQTCPSFPLSSGSWLTSPRRAAHVADRPRCETAGQLSLEWRQPDLVLLTAWPQVSHEQ